MGLPVTVFRHTDAGAPISGAPLKPSDWLIILKACLVTGYGSKQPLGWTLEFESVASFKMVFKNNISDGGSGGAFQVESHNGLDTVSSQVKFTAANQILDLDVFVEPTPWRTIPLINSTAYSKGWTIIGCGRSFYIRQEAGMATWNQTSSAYYNYAPMYWIGDVQSTVPNDQHVFTLLSGTYNRSTLSNAYGTEFYSNQFGGGTGTCGCVMYPVDGSGTMVAYTSPINPVINLAAGHVNDPTAPNVPILLTPVIMWHADLNSLNSPSYRGTIAGLYTVNYAGFWNKPVPVTTTIAGIDYEVAYGRSVAMYWIQSSGEWYD
jgi:hypothetical protein